jgi:hypothetical protein
MNWLTLKEDEIEIRGLPWFSGNDPKLWRLPVSAFSALPEGVCKQAVFPAGARIRLATDSPCLNLHGCSESGEAWQAVDVYVGGAFLKSVAVNENAESEILCFENCPRQFRDITLYLPYRHEIRISAIGIDREALLRTPAPFSKELPFVLYGSSIAQGATAARAGMAYASILGRMLNLDFVNLGFGGAGKAEPEVVDLVSSIDACCYLFDLGKSYGQQDASAYVAMLETIREQHSNTLLVCITPVFSTKEIYEPEYLSLSEHIRKVVRDAVGARVNSGDQNLALIDGLELLGPDDRDGFSKDGVHPNDLGFTLIAERLRQRLVPKIG